jgi:hypothetical protein
MSHVGRVRLARAALALAAVTFLVAAATATATTRGQAEAAARKAAIHYTHRFGIYFRNEDVKAGCRPLRKGWRCFVRMNFGQCNGTLRLKPNLHAYRYRIHCGE